MSRALSTSSGPATGTTSYRSDDTPQVPCELDPELWFGDDAEQNAAKRICWTECQVREACLKVATEGGFKWGTWGGFTERDRNGGRAPRSNPRPTSLRKEPTELSGCGTPGGYRNHYRLRQDACDACLEARRAHEAAARGDAAARTEQRRAMRTPPPCGTPAAYKRHLTAGETPCDPCRAAKADESRATRDRARRANGNAEIADVADIAHLVEQGIGLHRIATTLDVQAESVLTRLRRHGRHDLIERLKRAA